MSGVRNGRIAVVAIVAHPDDEALIAGGTLALAAEAGLATGVVCLTRGELGPISDPHLADVKSLGAVRERELQASCAALGVDWARCLEHPDGELAWADVKAVAAELAAILRPVRPSVLLTFGEDGLYGHPDHVATWRIAHRTTALLWSCGVHLYEAAWSPRLVAGLAAAAAQRGLPSSLWGLDPHAFGSPRDDATTRLDIRPVLDRKLRALRAHRTQLDPDHLLTGLPDDLAVRFLGEEAWRSTDPPVSPDVLSRLLGAGVRSAGVAHG